MNTLRPLSSPLQAPAAVTVQRPPAAAVPTHGMDQFIAQTPSGPDTTAARRAALEVPLEGPPPARRDAAGTPPVILFASDAAPAQTTGPRSLESRTVAERCHAVVFGAGSLDEKVDRIAEILIPAVEVARTPDASWTKATPQQVRLFVLETLEHTEGIRRTGTLRGLDWSQHDFEGDSSKFNPEITQFLARPGRDASVKWAIAQHNDAPHHAVWSNPTATAAELAESATDMVNAWRSERRVYDKPAWSYEKIEAIIAADFDDGRLSAAQRDALLQAIPFQKQLEGPRGG